jgi:hypothetical protein
MGIDVGCVDYSFSSSYGYWNTIRETIIKATFDYIADKFQKDDELYKNITEEDDEHYIGEGSNYFSYKNTINNFINSLSKRGVITNVLCTDNNLVVKFLNLNTNLSYIDALIYFNIGGLYALCNKNDCEGFYSVGNSTDIVLLFDLIEPFLKNYDDCYECIYVAEGRFSNRLYDVFKESIDKKQKVIIC